VAPFIYNICSLRSIREREREENERFRRLFRAKLSDKKKNCAGGDNRPVRILLEDCKINEQIIS